MHAIEAHDDICAGYNEAEEEEPDLRSAVVDYSHDEPPDALQADDVTIADAFVCPMCFEAFLDQVCERRCGVEETRRKGRYVVLGVICACLSFISVLSLLVIKCPHVLLPRSCHHLRVQRRLSWSISKAATAEVAMATAVELAVAAVLVMRVATSRRP